MVTEEYIQELKKKFVKGTVYRCPYDIECGREDKQVFNPNTKGAFKVLHGGHAVDAGYHDGKEATIISQPSWYNEQKGYELW